MLAMGRLLLVTLVLCRSLIAQESYLVAEAHSGKILYQVNSDVKRPIAGLAKVATAMVVLDWAKFSKANLSQMAVVPPQALGIGGSNPMAMIPGDRISLREALYSMLLGSDNVAAYTLAEHVGREIAARSSGTAQSAFMREMNHLGQALGMRRTRFGSAHGDRTSSSAKDFSRLAIYAARDTGFQFYVKQKSRTISSFRGNQTRSFKVSNTNTLLGNQGINGLRTGNSPTAGACLALSAEKKPLVAKLGNGSTRLTPRRLIVVILGSPDRFGRGQNLVQQGWAAYEGWRAQGMPIVDQAREILSVPQP